MHYSNVCMLLIKYIKYSDIDKIVGGVKTPNYHIYEGGLVVHPLVT